MEQLEADAGNNHLLAADLVTFDIVIQPGKHFFLIFVFRFKDIEILLLQDNSLVEIPESAPGL